MKKFTKIILILGLILGLGLKIRDSLMIGQMACGLNIKACSGIMSFLFETLIWMIIVSAALFAIAFLVRLLVVKNDSNPEEEFKEITQKEEIKTEEKVAKKKVKKAKKKKAKKHKKKKVEEEEIEEQEESEEMSDDESEDEEVEDDTVSEPEESFGEEEEIRI